jgi:hypothetical protein
LAGGVVVLPVDGGVVLEDGGVVVEPCPPPIELSPLGLVLEPMLLSELELLAA